MNVAIPHWRGRVSPVFDVAARFLIFREDGGQSGARHEIMMLEDGPSARASTLKHAGIGTVICATISQPARIALEAREIRIIAGICGDVERVLSAYAADALEGD